MGTGKPQIAILMAVYEPRMDWLREQLLSLNAQTYSNLKLYIRDDCSPTVPYDEIQSCVQDCIRAFPYEIQRNEKNLGSNGTFELLTREADGEYFAYCDQDDVWLPEKLSMLETCMEDGVVQMVCSDVQVIDGDGNLTADSITQVRHRHRFCSGSDEVFHALLTRNFAIGCTMLIRREAAREALPFLPEMVHDHWLAMVAASRGTVLSLLQPQIQYRIHGGNQTGVLVGISDKKKYTDVRIMEFEKRIRHIRERMPDAPYVERVYQWASARVDNSVHKTLGSALRLWKLREENPATTVFELFALRMPEPLFRQALKFAKKSG